jgi:hypothetical protein
MPYRNVEQEARFTDEEIRSVSRAFRVESATPERIVFRIPPWDGEAWFFGNPFFVALVLSVMSCPLVLFPDEGELQWAFLALSGVFPLLFLAFRRFAYAEKRVAIFPNTNLVTISCGHLAATRVAVGITKSRVLGFAMETDGVQYALWRRWFPSHQATIASVEFLRRLLSPDRQGAESIESHRAPADHQPGVSGIAPLDRAALAAVLRYFSFSSEKVAFRGPREHFFVQLLVSTLIAIIGMVTCLIAPKEALTKWWGLATIFGCPLLSLLNGIYWQVRASRLLLVVYAGAASVGVVRRGVETRVPLASGLFSFQAWESGHVTELSVDLDTCRGIILVPGDVDEAVAERSQRFLKAFAAPRVASPADPPS